jgi:hypothetical protein
MRRLISLLAAGIMASLSIMAAIGVAHAQKKAEARFWRDRGRGRNRDQRGRHDDRADSA